MALTALTIPSCVLLFKVLPVERMPQIDRDDMLARIEWNENIDIDENMRRTDLLTSALDTANLVEHSASVGEQDYMLDAGATLSSSETEIYVKAKSPAQLAELRKQLSATLK